MRADRLVSLVLLLRQQGRMTARDLADELEVSTRTVLRDMDALSAAGVPVYAERGRHGGYALLPGFRTELTGLTHDEALALLTVGPTGGDPLFGLGGALASARRKVVDALPDPHRSGVDGARGRFLVEPDSDLLSRRVPGEEIPADVMRDVRRAVLTGRRVRLRYAAPDEEPRWRTVDPVGLVTVRGRTYLLATRDGEDRTYRVSRVLAADVLPEPARRPADVDLDLLWRERTAQFLSTDHLPVVVTIPEHRREELLEHVRAVRTARPQPDGTVRLEVTYEDVRHAVWALWQLGPDAEVMSPASVRAALHERAAALAGRYAHDPPAGC